MQDFFRLSAYSNGSFRILLLAPPVTNITGLLVVVE